MDSGGKPPDVVGSDKSAGMFSKFFAPVLDSPVISPTPPTDFIRTIEWDMMDKSKFFPLSMASSFTVR